MEMGYFVIESARMWGEIEKFKLENNFNSHDKSVNLDRVFRKMKFKNISASCEHFLSHPPI